MLKFVESEKYTVVKRPDRSKLCFRTALVFLTKAKYLRQSERYKTVYISPDRSPEEREAHKQLVLQLKNKRDTDRESHHFIRDGKICSIPKTDNYERV